MSPMLSFSHKITIITDQSYSITSVESKLLYYSVYLSCNDNKLTKVSDMLFFFISTDYAKDDVC